MLAGALPYALPLFAAAALTGGLAAYVFRRAARAGALTFGLLMAAMSEWAAFYAVELLSPTLPGKVLAAKLQYLGIAAVPPLWLAFALHYTGRAAWLTRGRRLLLAAPGALTFALALTNEWHYLIWTEVGLDPGGAPALFIAGHGAWFWMHTLIAYAFILTGVVLYALAFARAARPYRRQMAVMLLGALTPLAGNALYLAGLSPIPWLDLTPLIFSLSGALLALGFFRFGLLELTPIAAPMVVEHLQDAVIVVDLLNRVTSLNPAAHRLFGVEREIIGRNLLDVLWPMESIREHAEIAEGQMELEIGEGEAQRAFQLTISPIRDDRRQLAGRLLVLRDITRERTLLEAERRRAERQRRLAQAAGDLMAAPDAASFWSTLMESARRMLSADRAAVYLYDRAADRLSCPYAAGLSAEYVAAVNRLFHSLPGGRLLSRPEPVMIADAQTDPDTAPLREFILREGFHSYAVFPLLAPEGVFGAFTIYRDAVRPFSEGEVTTGRTLAHVAASVFQNLRLLEAERRRARQMVLLNDITHASLRVDDFREMLQLLADRLGELFEADGAFLTLWDEAQGRTTPAAAYGELREMYRGVRFEPGERTMTGSVLNAGHPLAVEDVFNTPYLSPRIAALFPTRSMFALPLVAGGRKLGAALIAFNQTHHFTPDEVALGEQAAGQIALAVAKARLLEAEREQRQLANALRQAGLALSESLDLETVLDRLLDEIGRVAPYDAANVMLVEHSAQSGLGRIRIARMRGYEQFGEQIARDIAALSLEIATTENMRRMAETGRPLIIPDTANYPGWVKVEASAHVRSWAGAPIIAHGQVIAFFSLDKTEPDFYRPEHAERLAAFAGQAALAIENARLFTEVRRRAEEQRLLYAATRDFTAGLDEESVLQAIVRHMVEALRVTSCTISRWEPERDCVVTALDYTTVESVHRDRPGQVYALADYPATRRVLERREPLLIHAEDPTHDPPERALLKQRGYEALLMLPLAAGEHVFGLIELSRTAEAPPFGEREMRLAQSLAVQAAAALENARLHAQVQALAVTDGLTGLANRRAFDRALEREAARARRYGHPLALIILDIDSFKQYNDAYGHPAGDARLRAIAQLLASNLRDLDIAARYGGEEFAVILPHTDRDGAMAMAERIRAAAESAYRLSPIAEGVSPAAESGSSGDKPSAISHQPIPGYTLSLGVAVFPEDAQTPEALLLAADDAELAAKRAGKNRVCTAHRLKE